ncbi:hypothetical protein V8E53_000347 [Lactarius tabidus]
MGEKGRMNRTRTPVTIPTRNGKLSGLPLAPPTPPCILTLSYLLTSTVFSNSWNHFGSKSLRILTAVDGFYHAGQQDDVVSNILELVNLAAIDNVFARISRSRVIIAVPKIIGRPSPCRPEAQVRIATTTPSDARCPVTSVITPVRHDLGNVPITLARTRRSPDARSGAQLQI